MHLTDVYVTLREGQAYVWGLKGITPDLFDTAREVAMLENRRNTSIIVALGDAVVGAEAWSGRDGAPVEVCSATSRAAELRTIAANAEGALVLVRTNRERIEVKVVLARAHASKLKEADEGVLACGSLKDKTASGQRVYFSPLIIVPPLSLVQSTAPALIPADTPS